MNDDREWLMTTKNKYNDNDGNNGNNSGGDGEDDKDKGTRAGK